MSHDRPAAVAGRWYPAEAGRLAAAVDDYLAQARVEVGHTPRALVAPHAGLMYSGPVAAHAYKAALGGAFETVVLVGPSHFVSFEGVSVWPDGAWETPFGPVQVDRELAADVAACSDRVVNLPGAHRREHSLEMQMPFVAHLWPGARVVPLVMGAQTRSTSLDLGQALARAIAARGAGVLLVASSDLSHYEDATTAARLDGVVMAHVEAFDAEGLMSTLEREPGHACGGGPMVSVLDASRRLGAGRARVLRYADSGDVSGDKSAVVGYLAAGLW